MRKLMNKKDAGNMLKDQINESMLRVNAAKFGHSIEEIAPQYTNAYYLPDKSQYAPEKQVCKGNKRNARANRTHGPHGSGTEQSGMQRGSHNGSKFDDTLTRSMNGKSFGRPSRNLGGAPDGSPRISFARQAQVDFMNSKYLGQQGSPPFADKN